MAMRTDSDWDSKTKPQGSAASWGMVKGVMERWPMEKFLPAWKYSTEGRWAGSRLGVGAAEASSSSGSGSEAAQSEGIGSDTWSGGGGGIIPTVASRTWGTPFVVASATAIARASFSRWTWS